MKQLHKRYTFPQLHWKNMSHDQRNQTLEYHKFLKDKRDGTIKGRKLLGRNKQIYFISKEDESFPNVAK